MKVLLADSLRPDVIQFSHICKSYGDPEHLVRALDDINLEIDRGEFVALTGPSGCGKSTLLHLLGTLDTPSSGSLMVDGVALETADEREKTRYRRDDLGIVFQFFNLMPTMTVEENAMLPLLLAGGTAGGRKKARAKAAEMLELVGLTKRAGHFMHQLSGGEMQRTAIARALVHDPKLLIADEPTGNLDSENTRRVMAVLDEIHRRQLTTLVVVTHSETLAESASRRVHMRDGRIVEG